jgi:hypothetical protein
MKGSPPIRQPPVVVSPADVGHGHLDGGDRLDTPLISVIFRH